MSAPWEQSFRDIAVRVFPQDARLVGVSREGDGDWVLLISWRLASDPAQRSKRSKTIHLTVSEEALEDYCRSAPAERRVAHHRLEGHLRQRLAQFDPSHDAPLGTAPPQEKWLIGTRELND